MVSTDFGLTSAVWVKSSYSGGDGGQCIEFSRTLAQAHGLIPIRDSKNPDGPALVFPAAHWSSFVTAVKNGYFPV
ncbi:DUF397 domain-containing protein [Streptomyces chattanoogensis]|uniref:DUF397 domain-containing protein n=1 Tax=Streptomyces chattanoogensis TaxID=66876 RepID=UPI0005DA4335|nr:hypothetical protein T261_5609 [Streptomyces lydicus]